MHTLPRLERAESVAGLACPDCAGTLTVRVEGAAGHLRFKCRIGHEYALGSLLEAKEGAVEQRLWSALVSMEELASLLEELQMHGEPYTAGEAWTAASDRVTRLRAAVVTVRAVIERNVPIDLGPDLNPERDTAPSC